MKNDISVSFANHCVPIIVFRMGNWGKGRNIKGYVRKSQPSHTGGCGSDIRPPDEDCETVLNNYLEITAGTDREIPRQTLLDTLTGDRGWGKDTAEYTVSWMEDEGIIIRTGDVIRTDGLPGTGPSAKDSGTVLDICLKITAGKNQEIPRQMLLDILTEDTGWKEDKAEHTVSWLENDGVIKKNGDTVSLDTYFRPGPVAGFPVEAYVMNPDGSISKETVPTEYETADNTSDFVFVPGPDAETDPGQYWSKVSKRLETGVHIPDRGFCKVNSATAVQGEKTGLIAEICPSERQRYHVPVYSIDGDRLQVAGKDYSVAFDNTVIHALHPDMELVIVSIPKPPADLNPGELDKYFADIRRKAAEGIEINGEHHRLVAATGAKKKGDFLFAKDKHWGQRSSDTVEKTMAYSGIGLSSGLYAPVIMSDVNVTVVKEGKLGSDDCACFLSREMYKKLGIDTNTKGQLPGVQFRLAAATEHQDIAAKGTFRIMPRELEKAGHRMIIADSGFKGFGLDIGTHTVDRMAVAVANVSEESRSAKLSAQFTQWFGPDAVTDAYLGRADELIEKIADAYTDPKSALALMNHIGRKDDADIHSDEQEESQRFANRVANFLAGSDPGSDIISHPFVQQKIREYLRRTYKELAEGGGITVPARMWMPDSYVGIRNGETAEYRNWLPTGYVIDPTMPAGNIMGFRYPIRAGDDLIRLSRNLPTAEAAEEKGRRLLENTEIGKLYPELEKAEKESDWRSQGMTSWRKRTAKAIQKEIERKPDKETELRKALSDALSTPTAKQKKLAAEASVKAEELRGQIEEYKKSASENELAGLQLLEAVRNPHLAAFWDYANEHDGCVFMSQRTAALVGGDFDGDQGQIVYVGDEHKSYSQLKDEVRSRKDLKKYHNDLHPLWRNAKDLKWFGIAEEHGKSKRRLSTHYAPENETGHNSENESYLAGAVIEMTGHRKEFTKAVLDAFEERAGEIQNSPENIPGAEKLAKANKTGTDTPEGREELVLTLRSALHETMKHPELSSDRSIDDTVAVYEALTGEKAYEWISGRVAHSPESDHYRLAVEYNSMMLAGQLRRNMDNYIGLITNCITRVNTLHPDDSLNLLLNMTALPWRDQEKGAMNMASVVTDIVVAPDSETGLDLEKIVFRLANMQPGINRHYDHIRNMSNDLTLLRSETKKADLLIDVCMQKVVSIGKKYGLKSKYHGKLIPYVIKLAQKAGSTVAVKELESLREKHEKHHAVSSENLALIKDKEKKLKQSQKSLEKKVSFQKYLFDQAFASVTQSDDEASALRTEFGRQALELLIQRLGKFEQQNEVDRFKYDCGADMDYIDRISAMAGFDLPWVKAHKRQAVFTSEAVYNRDSRKGTDDGVSKLWDHVTEKFEMQKKGSGKFGLEYYRDMVEKDFTESEKEEAENIIGDYNRMVAQAVGIRGDEELADRLKVPEYHDLSPHMSDDIFRAAFDMVEERTQHIRNLHPDRVDNYARAWWWVSHNQAMLAYKNRLEKWGEREDDKEPEPEPGAAGAAFHAFQNEILRLINKEGYQKYEHIRVVGAGYENNLGSRCSEFETPQTAKIEVVKEGYESKRGQEQRYAVYLLDERGNRDARIGFTPKNEKTVSKNNKPVYQAVRYKLGIYDVTLEISRRKDGTFNPERVGIVCKNLRKMSSGNIPEFNTPEKFKYLGGFKDDEEKHSALLGNSETLIIEIPGRKYPLTLFHPCTISFYRREVLLNKEPSAEAKEDINKAHQAGCNFIVDETDIKVIEYLHKIKADFTIYHCGDKPNFVESKAAASSVEIGNVKNLSRPEPGKSYVYVGRDKSYPSGKAFLENFSVLGNPFPVIKGDRDASIAKYEAWLNEKIEAKDPEITKALAKIREMTDKSDVVLVCFCAPLRCHSEVIRDVIEKIPIKN